MKILFAGNQRRGVACLRALVGNDHQVVGVLAHPSAETNTSQETVASVARELGWPVLQPVDVNAPDVLASLRLLKPELTVLAGYGQIVKQPFIDLAPLGCLNLHGGKLPQYRGSSPLNWALINGESEFTLSIIRVDAGVDTGDVLAERTFPIGIGDTIADLHAIANKVFPEMLLEIIEAIRAGTARGRRQDETQAAYYPRRFPDDGLILWDLYTAWEVHNRIRALTDPYPGAFTFFQGRRVKLLASRLTERPYYGEPGRVYRATDRGLLVCARDRCLWIERATVAATGEDALPLAARYEKFATLRDLATAGLVR